MIAYRKAKPEDIHPAIALWLKIWDELIAPENASENPDYNEMALNSNLIKKYGSGERAMLVAADGDRIVGVIGADSNENHIKPPLCVDREYHRQGIATELLSRMVCELKVQGSEVIKLYSSRYAVPFYENFGFIQTGEEQVINDIVMIPMEYTPNEVWDILDENGGKTGRLLERGRRMAMGDCHLVVHVWKHNGRGEWLINKRASGKGKRDEGKWETTMGAALFGEDSLSAALRESKEELGIDLCPTEGCLFDRRVVRIDDGHFDFTDTWVFEHDCPLSEVRFQESETSEAMWATADKIREMMVSGEFCSDWFYPYFNEMTKKWGAAKNE